MYTFYSQFARYSSDFANQYNLFKENIPRKISKARQRLEEVVVAKVTETKAKHF